MYHLNDLGWLWPVCDRATVARSQTGHSPGFLRRYQVMSNE